MGVSTISDGCGVTPPCELEAAQALHGLVPSTSAWSLASQRLWGHLASPPSLLARLLLTCTTGLLPQLQWHRDGQSSAQVQQLGVQLDSWSQLPISLGTECPCDQPLHGAFPMPRWPQFGMAENMCDHKQLRSLPSRGGPNGTALAGRRITAGAIGSGHIFRNYQHVILSKRPEAIVNRRSGSNIL